MAQPGIKKQIHAAFGPRSLVLIGIMGAGKSSVGRRLAARVRMPFRDSDIEIEHAAGQSIEGIFAEYGEAFFRSGEAKVILRLLDEREQVLATGGGAFMNEEIRQHIKEKAISIWLKADMETLLSRVTRKDHRPLLKNQDPEKILAELIKQRYPIYAQSDITISSRNVPHRVIVGEIIASLRKFLNKHGTEDGVRTISPTDR